MLLFSVLPAVPALTNLYSAVANTMPCMPYDSNVDIKHVDINRVLT